MTVLSIIIIWLCLYHSCSPKIGKATHTYFLWFCHQLSATLYISFEYQSADLLTWTDCTTCAKPLTPWGWTQVGATSASSIKSVYWLTAMNYVFPHFPSVVSSSSWDRVYWLGWIGWFQVEGSTSLELKSTLHLRQGIKNLQHHCATIVVNDCCTIMVQQ